MWSKKGSSLQIGMELDRWCWMCDLFKSENGYCDMWEPDETS